MATTPTELIVSELRRSLPHFVPVGPSLRAAAASAGLLLVAGAVVAWVEMVRLRASTNPLKRFRFVGIAVAAALCSAVAASAVRDYVYRLDSIRLNQQHYANTVWIREYRRALVG
tara:strand:+ start:382 stop:726 length:345 start_codon:yes stop_codon:yes gene_type:complete